MGAKENKFFFLLLPLLKVLKLIAPSSEFDFSPFLFFNDWKLRRDITAFSLRLQFYCVKNYISYDANLRYLNSRMIMFNAIFFLEILCDI